MNKHKLHLLPYLLAAMLIAGVSLIAAQTDEANVRLVLKGDKTVDVIGPVKRLDGLALFRLPGGELSSIQESQIEEVIELKPGANTPADQATGSVPALSFSNADLPEPPAEPAPVEPAPTTPIPAPAADALTNSDLPTSGEVEPAAEEHATEATEPVNLPPGTLTNTDLPAAREITAEDEVGQPIPLDPPTDALTNTDLPGGSATEPVEPAAPSAPSGAWTNDDLPESPSAQAPAEPAAPVAPTGSALTNANLPTPPPTEPAAEPTQLAAPPPRPGAFTNADLPPSVEVDEPEKAEPGEAETAEPEEPEEGEPKEDEAEPDEDA